MFHCFSFRRIFREREKKNGLIEVQAPSTLLRKVPQPVRKKWKENSLKCFTPHARNGVVLVAVVLVSNSDVMLLMFRFIVSAHIFSRLEFMKGIDSKKLLLDLVDSIFVVTSVFTWDDFARRRSGKVARKLNRKNMHAKIFQQNWKAALRLMLDRKSADYIENIFSGKL